MKTLMTAILTLTILSSVFAKNPEDRTFLIIFDKEELKEFKTSPEYIELTFNQMFTTKTYSGNSESVLLMTIPNCNMDPCQVGELLVRVNRNTTLSLQEIAFRIVDLNESKSTYQALLAELESKNNNGKKKKDRGGILSLVAN
ncbi:hypothetical protein [Litoribacter populi]|uniref:hypothetical protein n=1 Tax=Litoribacter populi TaxID=2598460 RepID=UPI001F46467A|nr:hypothetical protein [Litoribacter populi]